jgi:hypothetical protein
MNRAAAGDVDECRAMYDDAVPRLPADGARSTAGQQLMIYAAAEGAALLGWTAELRTLYPLVVEALQVMPVRLFDFASGERIAGTAAAALGQLDDADRHFRRALEHVDRTPNRFDEPIVKHRYAEMLIARGHGGDRERAQTLLTEAIARYREAEMPLLRAAAERLTLQLDAGDR